jgi:Ca-activated chloride channel family protein
MNRRSAIREILLAGAGSLYLRGATDDKPQYTIRSDVRLVLLDVSVKNPRGRPVTGLTAGNFRVFDNDHPQSLTVFDSADEPVTVGILMDESSSMAPKRTGVITAALTLIEQSNPRDQVFILHFNENVQRGLPNSVLFSDNIDQLHAALTRGFPKGRTALYDAIVSGLEQLNMGRAGRKTLVLISDGKDTASTYKRRDMFQVVEASLATIYSIALIDPDDRDRDPGVLHQLAHISGGETFFPKDVTHLQATCRAIAREIRARYTLGYVPPVAVGDHSLRKVRVEVISPGPERLVAHTRTSYLS